MSPSEGETVGRNFAWIRPPIELFKRSYIIERETRDCFLNSLSGLGEVDLIKNRRNKMQKFTSFGLKANFEVFIYDKT